MSERTEAAKRTLVGVAVALAAAVGGIYVFVVVPNSLADLLGVLLAVALVAVAARVGARLAASAYPAYDVAEVTVEGPITRDGGGPLPGQPGATPADDVVEQIERADETEAAEALLLELNTPGGEVVPSDDIRNAAEAFDGPTVAYATDVCASGGYWIASGCDELWARDASLVGSIGVIGSRVNAKALADRVGLSYEQLTAGEYKDAGLPLKEFDERDRAYLQGLIDDYYDNFVERVTDGRDLDPDAVRDTEARVFLGEEAQSIGLVDELGTREDVKSALADRLHLDEVTVEAFEPERSLVQRLGAGARSIAYAAGAGAASVVADRGDVDGFEFRL